ncbi:MAG: hypothetical protein PHO37_12320 [Kiritimatiellae bacterium]|nr:hypothetical protein [Kiritimatiellia bacterium]
MIYKLSVLFFLFAALGTGVASQFDYNKDGVVRCAVLSGIEPKEGLNLALLCSDLEGMIKADSPGVPVRVSVEPIKESKTIFGWWYHPASRVARAGLMDAGYDFVFLAEKESVISSYPEVFFEGVYTSVNNLASPETRVMLLMVESQPSSSFRDKSIYNLAELTYRVGDGCGAEVVPAAFAWNDVLRHNILTGDSLLKNRSNSYLAAASIWCQVAGRRVPKGALSTDWVVKKTATALAGSARDAVGEARKKKHYSGLFKGVVRTESRMQQRYMIYQPGAAVNPDLQLGLEYIFNAAGQEVFQRSTADWYSDGFDRHSAAFDLVYGTVREMELFQDQRKYTSTEYISEKLPEPLRVVYNRNMTSDKDESLTLRTLENLLLDGYDFARNNNCVFIPYQIAWARALAADPAYARPAVGKAANDWTSYMLANMIYTSLTGSFQLPPQREKPYIYDEVHPRGYHTVCAQIGWQCMRQLSDLNSWQNTVVVGSESWFVDAANPGFLAIRLLEPPSERVRVLCQPDTPGTITLSQNILEFTPDNYNIEQIIRCTAESETRNQFCAVLMKAESRDTNIDGSVAQRPFLLNYDDKSAAGFTTSKTSLTLKDQSYVMFTPDTRPVDVVHLRVLQNGVETSSVYFSPNFYTEYPICLFPTKEALQKGECHVSLRAVSKDLRFNNFAQELVFKIDTHGVNIPEIKMIAPALEVVIKGPAFVNAEAVVEGAEEPCELSLFCGKKRLGLVNGPRLQSAVEMGPPQSRLSPGRYPLWAAVRLKSGVVVATDVSTLVVE